jgi:hypothetical protein
MNTSLSHTKNTIPVKIILHESGPNRHSRRTTVAIDRGMPEFRRKQKEASRWFDKKLAVIARLEKKAELNRQKSAARKQKLTESK